MRKTEIYFVADKSIITSLTAKIQFSYFLNSSSLRAHPPPFSWMIINAAVLCWIRSWQLWTLRRKGACYPGWSDLCVSLCACCPSSTMIERNAKERKRMPGFWSMAPSSGSTISAWPVHREHRETWTNFHLWCSASAYLWPVNKLLFYEKRKCFFDFYVRNCVKYSNLYTCIIYMREKNCHGFFLKIKIQAIKCFL